MVISAITLERHVDIYEAMTDRQTHHAGSETFTPAPPELDTIVIFQNDASNSATLIEIGKFLPTEVG